MSDILQKKNNYELALIFGPEFSEEQIKTSAKQVEDLISQYGGLINRLHEVKKIKLAYPIKKKLLANLGIIEFMAPGENVPKIHESLKNNREVIRYIISKAEEEKGKKRKAAKMSAIKTKPRLVQKEEKVEIKEGEIEKKLEEILEKI